MSKLNQAFKKNREILKLTQKEVARRAGVEQRQISLFEAGRDIRLSTLRKIAAAADLKILLLPIAEASKIKERTTHPSPAQTSSNQSLLDTYRVEDEFE